MNIQLAEEVAAQAEEESLAMLGKVEAFTIASAEQYSLSGEFLRQIKGKQNELAAARSAITQPLDEAKARVIQLFLPASTKLAEAEQRLKQAMLAFTKEQQRQAAEAQARLDQQEAREREKLRRQVEAKRAEGKEARAEVLEERAAAVPTVKIEAAPPPKVAGVTIRKTWRAEVADFPALIKAVSEGKAAREFLLPNMAYLNACARTQKEELSIPGVEAVCEEGVAAQGI